MEGNLNNLMLLNQMAHDAEAKPGPILFHFWGHIEGHTEHYLHRHSFFESCFVIGGNGVYEENGAEYPLSAGSMFLSKPGVWHQIFGTPAIDLIWVAFEAAEVADTEAADTANSTDTAPDCHPLRDMVARLSEPSRIHVAADEASLTAALWRALLANADFAPPFMRESLSAMTLALIGSFAELFCGPQTELAPAPPSGGHAALLHQAKLLIRDNLSQKIRFSELADYLHISERSLSRLFQMEEGQSFTEFYRKERVKKACQLLKTSDLTLEEIAQETGFYSVHHLSRVFKFQLGVSPGRYRKQ